MLQEETNFSCCRCLQELRQEVQSSLYLWLSKQEVMQTYLPVFSSSDLDDPVITVHQSVGEAKEQFYFERTVFLRCVANSNPPVHYTWRRGREALSQGSDSGVEIYEPFFTQVNKHTFCFYVFHYSSASLTEICSETFLVQLLRLHLSSYNTGVHNKMFGNSVFII